jgi:uncharacterized integral membrane protein
MPTTDLGRADLASEPRPAVPVRRNVDLVTNPPQPGQAWQTPDPTAANLPAGGEVTPTGSAPARPRRTVSPKMILLLVLLVALVWFILVNLHSAKISLWVHSYNVPVWLVLLCTFVAGMLVDRLLSRRKRKQRS